MAAWSSGMIPVLGTGGQGFNSPSGPFSLPSKIHTQNSELAEGEADKKRSQPGLNRRPLGLQPNALPLSYRTTKFTIVGFTYNSNSVAFLELKALVVVTILSFLMQRSGSLCCLILHIATKRWNPRIFEPLGLLFFYR